MAGERFARFFRNSLVQKSSRRGDSQDANPTENKSGADIRLGSSFSYSAGHPFFEYLVVVSLKKDTKGNYEPKITYQFPKICLHSDEEKISLYEVLLHDCECIEGKRENLLRGQREEEERLLQAIPLFCFPDGNEWAPVVEYKRLDDSGVKMGFRYLEKISFDEKAMPIPSGRDARLPEVYCIVSCLGCFGLFSKILDEVEKRRQISAAVVYPFMQGLRESPFPAPGRTVTIKSFIPESGTEQIELTRPLDSHLEHVEFQALLRCLSPEKILLIFASVVLERRIIFLADELSSLSTCIHSAAALLYPFTWAHTYIPVVPEKLLSTVCCPTPFMVGIQKRYLAEVQDQPMEEVGDEEEILPPKLRSEMLHSLPAMNNNIQTSEEFNAHVSDTFIQFFVRMIGHYPAHIKWSRNGTGSFQEQSFCKALTSKTNRRFVKKFVKTQMFSLFIQEAEKSKKCIEGYFQQKLNEYQEKKYRRLS
ncbi:hypothetical protein Chor_004003 [Crotalus horridus]